MRKIGARILSVIAMGAVLSLAGSAQAGDRPHNVSDRAHEWFSAHLDDAMPMLIQTDMGALDQEHVYVVTDLGNWGAARRGGGHQGTDFVIDLPHKEGDDRLRVGSVVDGRVIHSEENWGAYGNTLFIVTEDPQLVFIYAHLDRIDVSVGDVVGVGDWLGLFGCTGNCRGLKGESVRHQVHVEVYAMPDDWTPDVVDWDHLPLRQLRTAAHHDRGKPHGVDIARYFESFQLQPISRSELSEQYAHHRDNGGLTGYLDACEEEYAAELEAMMSADMVEEDAVDEAVAADEEGLQPDKRLPGHLLRALSGDAAKPVAPAPEGS